MDYGRIVIHEYPYDRADLDSLRAERSFRLDGFRAAVTPTKARQQMTYRPLTKHRSPGKVWGRRPLLIVNGVVIPRQMEWMVDNNNTEMGWYLSSNCLVEIKSPQTGGRLELLGQGSGVYRTYNRRSGRLVIEVNYAAIRDARPPSVVMEAEEMERDTITLVEVATKKAQLEGKINDLLLAFALETGLRVNKIGYEVTHRVGEPSTLGVRVEVLIP